MCIQILNTPFSLPPLLPSPPLSLFFSLSLFFFFFLGLIKQFLRDVNWGDLDYLLIDTPPGTSDEHLSIISYLKKTKIDGAVVVTTPQVYICVCGIGENNNI